MYSLRFPLPPPPQKQTLDSIASSTIASRNSSNPDFCAIAMYHPHSVYSRFAAFFECVSSFIPPDIIEMKGFYTKKKCAVRLRRIRVKDPETGKYIVLLTNQLQWAATTVSAIYKDRWQIEIFFKAMKQKLKIKSFLGTSRNAILCQIWVAMIAYLLLSYLKFVSTHKWTINSLMAVLPMLLFSRRDLWEWLNFPFGKPPDRPDPSIQLELI